MGPESLRALKEQCGGRNAKPDTSEVSALIKSYRRLITRRIILAAGMMTFDCRMKLGV